MSNIGVYIVIDQQKKRFGLSTLIGFHP